jgi:hypothetical protein
VQLDIPGSVLNLNPFKFKLSPVGYSLIVQPYLLDAPDASEPGTVVQSINGFAVYRYAVFEDLAKAVGSFRSENVIRIGSKNDLHNLFDPHTVIFGHVPKLDHNAVGIGINLVHQRHLTSSFSVVRLIHA